MPVQAESSIKEQEDFEPRSTMKISACQKIVEQVSEEQLAPEPMTVAQSSAQMIAETPVKSSEVPEATPRVSEAQKSHRSRNSSKVAGVALDAPAKTDQQVSSEPVADPLLIDDQQLPTPHSDLQIYEKEGACKQAQSDPSLSDSNRTGILKDNAAVGVAIKSESSKKSITWRNQVQEAEDKKQPSPLKQTPLERITPPSQSPAKATPPKAAKVSPQQKVVSQDFTPATKHTPQEKVESQDFKPAMKEAPQAFSLVKQSLNNQPAPSKVQEAASKAPEPQRKMRSPEPHKTQNIDFSAQPNKQVKNQQQKLPSNMAKASTQ